MASIILQKPEVSDRWIQQLRRNNKAISSWACTLCPDGRVFTSSPSLWEHAQSDHFKHLPSRNEELQKFRIEFEAESAQRTSTTKKDDPSRKPNLNEASRTQPERLPSKRPVTTRTSLAPVGSLSDLGALNLDSLGESGDLNMRDADEVADGQPRKRPSIGDGISAGSASPFRDASASPPPRRSKARPTSASYGMLSEENMYDTQRPAAARKSLWTEQDVTLPLSRASVDPSNITSVQAQRARKAPYQQRSQKPCDSQSPRTSTTASNTGPKTPAPQTLVSLPSDNDDIILQPETRSISQEQLVTEVKSIYANLVIVEANCIEVGKKEATLRSLESTRGSSVAPNTTVETPTLQTLLSAIPPTRSLPPRAKEYKRKAIQLVVKGITCFARPDSGSDRNIITAAFAKDHNVEIQRGKDDKDLFVMGNGQHMRSIGKALIPCSLLGGESHESYWFHVMSKCSVPIIMGLEFLHKIQLYTTNQHLLVDSPFTFGNMPSFKWIGSPKGKMEFFADGHILEACADTGSDLDLMSLRCAIQRGFKVDRKRKTRIMLADETVIETIGQVDLSSVQLPGFDSFKMSFHVLPNLVCDVIFGEEFLEQTDAFNTCKIINEEDLLDLYSLNTLINLGPLQALFTKMFHRKKTRSMQQRNSLSNGVVSQNAIALAMRDHDKRIEAEMYRQHRVDRLIERMKEEGQGVIARTAEEEATRMAFLSLHTECAYCTGMPIATVSPSIGSGSDESGGSSQS